MMAQLQYVQRALYLVGVCFRHLLEILWERARRSPGVPGPQRLRSLLEELGGSFLKFGQILSLQVDTLPREYCDALLNLLDRVPPFGRDAVRKVFVEEFGKPPEELYREFNYQTLASASIGQVHRAVLKDSTVVAVKVQRPEVQEIFRRDAALLRLFVRVVFALKIRTLYFMRDPVHEFNDWLVDELDYRREAAYGEALGRNARETPTEIVPRIHWALTTSRVLTMDFLEGYSVMEYLRLAEKGSGEAQRKLQGIGFDPPLFIANVVNNFLSDAFRYGIFHADLHPANLLILKNNVVGYVDFGIVGHLTPEARRKQIQLSMAYARGKTEEIFSAFLNVSTLTPGVDLAGFRRELERRVQQWYQEPAVGGVPHLQRSLTVAMFDLLALCRSYGLLVDREMIKYIRSLMLVDGLVSRLSPGLDLTPQIRKVCEDFLAREAQNKLLSPGAALSFLADLCGWLSADPAQMLRAMERIERRQARSQPREYPGSDLGEEIRTRTLAAGAVWVTLAIAALWNRQMISLGALPFSGYIFIGTWGAWTIWLVSLLRRLART
ncbi:MAG: AarF/ABC1/UbiB kinase family protein [Acidobacteria bacterium]|nr:AarF/ABC1/UbiB kinase family protein [Acidobacteriota bacterium]